MALAAEAMAVFTLDEWRGQLDKEVRQCLELANKLHAGVQVQLFVDRRGQVAPPKVTIIPHSSN